MNQPDNATITSAEKAKPGSKRPDCNACVHYYITHDPSFRYGCRAMGFKSARQPALDVIAASGQPCEYQQNKS